MLIIRNRLPIDFGVTRTNWALPPTHWSAYFPYQGDMAIMFSAPITQDPNNPLQAPTVNTRLEVPRNGFRNNVDLGDMLPPGGLLIYRLILSTSPVLVALHTGYAGLDGSQNEVTEPGYERKLIQPGTWDVMVVPN